MDEVEPGDRPFLTFIAPRTRPLDGMLSTWSPGTKQTLEAPVILFPDIKSPAEFEAALPRVKDKFVLLSLPWTSCRPDTNWKEFATPGSFENMQKGRDTSIKSWYVDRLRASGVRELL